MRRDESYSARHESSIVISLAGRMIQEIRYCSTPRHYGLALEEQPGFAQAAAALRRVQSRLN